MSRHLLVGAVALLFCVGGFSQTILFGGDRVVVDKLDGEVLYTFARYYNQTKVWSEVFPVRVKGAAGTIAGRYEVGDSAVAFFPAFPFVRGVDYEASFYSAELAQNANEVYLPKMSSSTLKLEFKLQATASETPSVVAVFPTANELPENLLRFHIEFSSPMTRGEVYKRVRFLDEQEKEVERAILIVDEELWDEDMRSVTVMLDPGRIKRGLRANLEMSAPLTAGRKYKLVIEPGWKNSDGAATTEAVVKTFTCYAADRSKPVSSGWRLVAPALPLDPLLMKMGETYDVVLLRKAFVVIDALGNQVDGTISVSERESVVSFVPDRPWLKEKYTVVVNPKLEDLAGNNMTREFDRDLHVNNEQLEGAISLTLKPECASCASLRR